MAEDKRVKSEVIRVTRKEKELLEELRDHYEHKTPEKVKTSRNGLYRGEGRRVLVVGDIHCPFDLDSYLDHCLQVYNDFHCDTVVFIGDIIDNHFSSFHPTNPDGFGAGEELERAIHRLQRWYTTFPSATVIIGNHDRMASRKAFSGGVPKAWIKEYGDVLSTPNWNYEIRTFIDGVEYVHGEGGTARTRIKNESHSIVQGHLHTQAYIDWVFSETSRKFGMQVGTGIDWDAYAFDYAKAGKKPAVACGVVLNGEQPFLIPMSL